MCASIVSQNGSYPETETQQNINRAHSFDDDNVRGNRADFRKIKFSPHSSVPCALCVCVFCLHATTSVFCQFDLFHTLRGSAMISWPLAHVPCLQGIALARTHLKSDSPFWIFSYVLLCATACGGMLPRYTNHNHMAHTLCAPLPPLFAVFFCCCMRVSLLYRVVDEHSIRSSLSSLPFCCHMPAAHTQSQKIILGLQALHSQSHVGTKYSFRRGFRTGTLVHFRFSWMCNIVRK